ncbi:RNA-binding protein 6 isoform X1 [Scomber japonicus]|uniref:RNA-binding protein 6 isoform X1 n=1 Tax=Scomber japonicus TaxID=13676 RepID=UPI002306232D|nr:RNA-binding protein 6 isoform X1 [Scomber japonicus]
MWDGPGQGPRGGPPFRGDHRGETFGGRDRPMPDYRNREGMNMGPMGHMGPRPLDGPPMDMRRMDGPPMRGRDMDPRDMRGREPNRDFLRPGEEPDFSLRRQYEVSIRDKLMNSSGFPGPGRNSGDMGGRGMPPREPNSRFMDTRDRDTFQYDMPRFGNPNMDGRRGFPIDRMERNDGFRDMRDRPPMGIGDTDRYDMDVPPRERRIMDIDRRGGPPFNPRGGFDSDMDFRNRPGPPAEFRGRERSPLRLGNSDVPPVGRARSEMPPAGPQRSEFMGAKDQLRERDYPDASNSPLMDYRSGEEMTLAEEWKNRRKDKNPFLNINEGVGGVTEPSFPGGFGRDVNVRDPPPFQERDRPSADFPGKDAGFPHSDHFAAMNLPPIGGKAPQGRPLPEISPLTGPLGRENESKHWLGERDPKHSQTKSNRDERPPYHQEKNQPSHETQEPNDCFKGLKDNQGPARSKMGAERDFQSSNPVQTRDQDYRDIDYRTGSGRGFDYKREELQAPEKFIKESKPITPSKFSESGSQDQDYRNAAVEDKASNTISIIGIPKTATMEQILGAFTVRDGVPMQGMKIKNVVPGYSYDTAYVEFLNLEDAVHFMESNKGSLKVGTRTVSMRYFQPDERERDVHKSDHKVPQLQEPQLPRPDQPLEQLKPNLNGSKPKGPMEPLSHSQWQRSSDLTPEAWQQQVDQQLQQQETEQQAESWGNRNPHHSSHQSDSVFKDSKTMIIKNVKPTTTVETILKALDPFAYLDERNVRLVKAKPPGAKCFCFVDMDSHEQVTRLVELLTKPRPLYIDGVRVYAEVAKPLKNQNFRRDLDKPNSSILGYPPEASIMGQQQYAPPPPYLQGLPPPNGAPPIMQGNLMIGSTNSSLPSDPSISQGIGYGDTLTLDPSYQSVGTPIPPDSTGMSVIADGSQAFMLGSETPDVSNYLYDATSGFYYDPETTLYYDPSSRYFYNAQTQEYLYWDAVSKTYIPVPGGNPAETQSLPMTAEDQAILSNPAADAPLEMKKPSMPPYNTETTEPVPASSASSAPESVPCVTGNPEKKEDEDASKKDNKEEKPRSLAAVKIMKDMERWAKIQNRQKESIRSPSPLLKTGLDDDRRQSKSADAGFTIFERKISGGDDLFKKPLAPAKKDEKSKRPMGSLGLLASDYAAGSDEEVEEDKEDAAKGSQSEDKEDKLTDWKKMACLLCRRQFPNKDALIRHQQLSDLHKQNMEIHLKIKRSKKELEALENQEKELSAKDVTRSPEQKRKKHHHQQPQQHNTWAGSSREMNKVSERPGLGAEPVPKRKKKEPVVWDHATYKQAVRKAMFARFKELE